MPTTFTAYVIYACVCYKEVTLLPRGGGGGVDLYHNRSEIGGISL